MSQSRQNCRTIKFEAHGIYCHNIHRMTKWLYGDSNGQSGFPTVTAVEWRKLECDAEGDVIEVTTATVPFSIIVFTTL